MAISTINYTETYTNTHSGSGEQYYTWTPTLSANAQTDIQNLLNNGYTFTGAHGYFKVSLYNNYSSLLFGKGPAGSVDANHLTMTYSNMPLFEYVHRPTRQDVTEYNMEPGNGGYTSTTTTVTAYLEFNTYIQNLILSLPTVKFYYGRRSLSYQDEVTIEFSIDFYFQTNYVDNSSNITITNGLIAIASFNENEYTYGSILNPILNPAGYHQINWSGPSTSSNNTFIVTGVSAVSGGFALNEYTVEYYIDGTLYRTLNCIGNETYYHPQLPSSPVGYINFGWCDTSEVSSGAYGYTSSGTQITKVVSLPATSITTALTQNQTVIPQASFINLTSHNGLKQYYGTSSRIKYIYEIKLIEADNSIKYYYSYYGLSVSPTPTKQIDGYDNSYWWNEDNNQINTINCNIDTTPRTSRKDSTMTLLGNETYHVITIPKEYNVTVATDPNNGLVSINTPQKGTFTFNTDTVQLNATSTNLLRFKYWTNNYNNDIIETSNYSYLNNIPNDVIWTAHFLSLDNTTLFYSGNKAIIGGFYFDENSNYYPLVNLYTPAHENINFQKFNINYNIVSTNIAPVSCVDTAGNVYNYSFLNTTTYSTTGVGFGRATTLKFTFFSENSTKNTITSISCKLYYEKRRSESSTISIWYDGNKISSKTIPEDTYSGIHSTTLDGSSAIDNYDLSKLEVRITWPASASYTSIYGLYLVVKEKVYILQEIIS